MLAQLIVGVVQKGQCGEPCAKLETMLAKMMQKMGGFFNAAIADVRTAVDTGEKGEEHTIQSLFNITTLPAIYIYQYGVKEPKKVRRSSRTPSSSSDGGVFDACPSGVFVAFALFCRQ